MGRKKEKIENYASVQRRRITLGEQMPSRLSVRQISAVLDGEHTNPENKIAAAQVMLNWSDGNFTPRTKKRRKKDIKND